MNEWISVDERLPEIGEEVIVYRPNKGRRKVTALVRLCTEWYNDGKVMRGWIWDNAYPPNGNTNLASLNGEWVVTYWMPLPKPPEEKP